jgi:glycosyltransferase involved in cell wall biosynthesis
MCGNEVTMQDIPTVSLPTVSVIIPMRNEEQHIAGCLESVAYQEYPKDLMEVLVIDGMSEDTSREIVTDYTMKYSFIRLLYNPGRATTSALNKGIVESQGQIIVRVDAHCSLEPDYIHSCVNALIETKAENVGGLMRPTGTTFLEKAIGLAISSPFGIGGGKFHYCEKEMFVDTVYLGAYPRKVFDNIGLYDENAHYSEDDELNYRLIKSGGKIFLSPQIKSRYYPRSSLSALWRQYLNYGWGKVRTIKKHGKPAAWRHLAPPVFLVSVIGSLLLFVFNPTFWWLTAGICGSYIVSATLVSAKTSFNKGWKYFPVLPLVFATLHISYGTGFLLGTFQFYFFDSMRQCRWKRKGT